MNQEALRRRLAFALCGGAALLPAAAAPARAADAVRVATFNLALYGRGAGDVAARLSTGDDPQAQALAEIIQRVRPDVLVLNEIDYDEDGAVLAAFCENYLAVGQNFSKSSAAAEPIEFPHRMAFATNTGVHSGLDIDRNGQVAATPGAAAYAGDCWGYGVYPGQYAFALLSRHPIDAAAVRQFRKFAWKDMPGARLPDDAATSTPSDWYSPEVLDQFRLSSKNHCDVPVTIGERRVHLLLSHPTPPVFDGAEDRNGRRNHDELRFWADYIGPAEGSAYIVDDAGRRGGLAEGARSQESGVRDQGGEDGAADATFQPSFIILGDLNGDPHDGDGPEGIGQLLAAPPVLQYSAPTSLGGVEAARLQGGRNARHRGDHAQDTEDAGDDPGPGNLRLDFILPSKDKRVTASGVFWPETGEPLQSLVAGAAHPASSDHRLVWIDVTLDAADGVEVPPK